MPSRQGPPRRFTTGAPKALAAQVPARLLDPADVGNLHGIEEICDGVALGEGLFC
jgi:hypothetical protein